jgi:diguanylate cyclase (GGDEF)-like protein
MRPEGNRLSMNWIRSSHSSFAPRVEHGFWALHGLMILGLLAWFVLSWSVISLTAGSALAVAAYVCLSLSALLLTRLNLIHFSYVFWPVLVGDLVIVSWLIVATEGMSSNFYLLYFALVPFVAFYHGLRVGMIAAAIVTVCYYLVALPHGEPNGLSNYAFRVIMLGLFTVATGFAARIIRQSESRLLSALDKLNERTTELERTHGQLETIYETSRSLAELLSIDMVVSRVLHIARSVLSFPICELYTWDAHSRALWLQGRADPEQSSQYAQPRRTKVNDAFRRAIEEMSAVRIVDRHAGREIIDGHPYRSQLLVPMISEGRLVGILSAESPKVNAFGDREERVFSILAASTAMALVNADLHQRMEKLTIIDELTGVYNYRYFRTRLEDERKRSVRYGQPLSLLMVDIDWFKQLNDHHGHEIGNVALRRLSELIQTCIRDVDILARYGGEEFIIILPQTGIDEARTLGERIRRTVERSDIATLPDGKAIRLTVSIGVSCFPDNGRPESALVDSVDQALYRAKGAGKNLVCTT